MRRSTHARPSGRFVASQRYFLVCSTSQDWPKTFESPKSMSRGSPFSFICSDTSTKERSRPCRSVKKIGFHRLTDGLSCIYGVFLDLAFKLCFLFPVVILLRRSAWLLAHRARGDIRDEEISRSWRWLACDLTDVRSNRHVPMRGYTLKKNV
jgi:hypothetical protein